MPEVEEFRIGASSASRQTRPAEGVSGEEAGSSGAAAFGASEIDKLNISLFPLYQILDSYIIAQSDDGDIIIIDQHAAAERINYERLLEKYSEGKQSLCLLYTSPSPRDRG